MAGFFRSWVNFTAVAVLSLSATVAAFPVDVCATTAPTQEELDFNSSSISVPSHPFGIVYLDENIAFAAIERTVGVLSTKTFKPKLVYQIPLPTSIFNNGTNSTNPPPPAPTGSSTGADPTGDDYNFDYHGVALTSDKVNLYVATGLGAVILDTRKAAMGRNDSVVGTLNSGKVGNSSVQITITPDDKYVFISQEFGTATTGNRGAIEVFNVNRMANGTVVGTYVGNILLGYAVVGTALSHDNTKLYVTSETAVSASWTQNITAGTISLLDVATLKKTPSKSLLYTVAAGCHPVRIKVAPDGKTVWVTARESNQLLVYNAHQFESNWAMAQRALLGTVQVGTSPVAIAMVGHYVITADSNRFGYSNTTTGLTVVNADLALAGQFEGFPQIPTGQFPREFGLSPDSRTLLVSEYDGLAIRSVDVSSLLVPAPASNPDKINIRKRTFGA